MANDENITPTTLLFFNPKENAHPLSILKTITAVKIKAGRSNMSSKFSWLAKYTYHTQDYKMQWVLISIKCVLIHNGLTTSKVTFRQIPQNYL